MVQSILGALAPLGVALNCLALAELQICLGNCGSLGVVVAHENTSAIHDSAQPIKMPIVSQSRSPSVWG